MKTRPLTLAALAAGAPRARRRRLRSSSNNSSSTAVRQLVPRAARSTAPARRSPPPSTSSGARPQGQGHHRQLPAGRLGRRHRPALAAGTADFGASDPALKPEDRKALTKGQALQIPMFFGAITVSYNVTGAPKGLKLDGADGRRHLPRQDQEVERPGDRQAQPGRQAAGRRTSPSSTAPTSRARRRASPRSSRPTAREWKTKVGADKTVKWPTGTGAKGNDGVAAAVKQTDGRGRLRRAGLRPAEQLHDRRRQEQVRASSSRPRSPRRRRPARA